jgi:hypothetical protein
MNNSLELFRGSHWAAPISELIAWRARHQLAPRS